MLCRYSHFDFAKIEMITGMGAGTRASSIETKIFFYCAAGGDLESQLRINKSLRKVKKESILLE